MYTVSDVIGIILVILGGLLLTTGCVIALVNSSKLSKNPFWSEKDDRSGIAAILCLFSLVVTIAGAYIRYIV